jgi:hypothetical protein
MLFPITDTYSYYSLSPEFLSYNSPLISKASVVKLPETVSLFKHTFLCSKELLASVIKSENRIYKKRIYQAKT